MAKDSSADAASKKVQRAAQTAGQRDKSFIDRVGFGSIVALICVLGIGLVAFSRANRPEATAVENQDHWHAVFAVYDCAADGGEFVSAEESASDPTHSHPTQEGLMHVLPRSEDYEDGEATLSVFFDQMGIQVSDDEVTLPSGRVLKDGTDCDGEPAQLELRKWPFAWEVDSSEPEVITSDFGSVKLDNDGEVYELVLAPEDADIPEIPQERLDSIDTATEEMRDLRDSSQSGGNDADDSDADAEDGGE